MCTISPKSQGDTVCGVGSGQKGKSLFEVHQSYLRTLGPCYLIGWILTRLIRESRGESDLKEDLADLHSQDPEKRFWDPVCNTVSFLANKEGN